MAQAHHQASYAPGDRVWVPDEDDAWIIGTIVSYSAAKAEVRTDKGAKSFGNKDPNYSRLEICGSHTENNIENLVDLDELSEGAILHHVRKRFTAKNIYTFVGAILVAVNPFEGLPIYGPADIRRASDTSQPRPHVFVTGAVAYQQLQANMKNQSVLIRLHIQSRATSTIFTKIISLSLSSFD